MASQSKTGATTARFQRRVDKPKRGRYVLRLYVTGMTRKSLRAIENIKAVCDEHLKGRYELEIIDIYQHPSLVQGEQIIATPTLVKRLPLPLRHLVGDFTDKNHVLLGLDVRAKK